jgi:hypothetical protein
VVGSLLIIVGLYAFLWGKGKEMQVVAKKDASASPPLGGDESA